MITNQHIVIVGGTAGIGLAVAQMAADAGAEVRLGGSNRDRLDQALRQFNGKVKGELVDVRDEDSIRRFFVHAGAIDHVVSTIGLNYRPVRQMTSRKAGPAAAIALALLATGAGFLAFGQDVTDGNLPQPKLVIMDKSLPAD